MVFFAQNALSLSSPGAVKIPKVSHFGDVMAVPFLLSARVRLINQGVCGAPSCLASCNSAEVSHSGVLILPHCSGSSYKARISVPQRPKGSTKAEGSIEAHLICREAHSDPREAQCTSQRLIWLLRRKAPLRGPCGVLRSLFGFHRCSNGSSVAHLDHSEAHLHQERRPRRACAISDAEIARVL